MGFGKKHGLYKRKLGTKDNTRPSFKKERLNVQQTNALRKKVAESHHHTPRSPQKKRQETVSPSTIAEPLSSDSLVAVSPIAEPLSSVSLVAVSPVAEPLSSQSVSLVAQEVMPRELRSAKNNNKKRKNYGNIYIKRRLRMLFIIILMFFYCHSQIAIF